MLTIFIFNITFGAAWSVLVLYASQRLGLGDIGFGLLTTVMADHQPVGRCAGVPGVGCARLHLGTTSVTIRQRVVPTNLQGRVGSVNMVGTYWLVIGSGIGGVLAQHFGVTAPFWFAFVGSAVFVIVIWRQPATSPTRTSDRAHRAAGRGCNDHHVGSRARLRQEVVKMT